MASSPLLTPATGPGIVITGPPNLVLTSQMIDISLFRLAMQKCTGFSKRVQEIARIPGLTMPEKIVLLRTHMRLVIAHLTYQSATSDTANTANDDMSNNGNNNGTASTISTAPVVAPFTTAANYKPKVACTKKEGRCVGQYCVLPNGKFHGSHDNTGCSGVPVTQGPPKKRKRIVLVCSDCDDQESG